MDNKTLAVLWGCTCGAFAIMILRLVLRKLQREKFELGDYLIMAAIFCLAARLSFLHVSLEWGANDIPERVRETHVFTPQEIYRRETGSKLRLANRAFLTT